MKNLKWFTASVHREWWLITMLLSLIVSTIPEIAQSAYWGNQYAVYFGQSVYVNTASMRVSHRFTCQTTRSVTTLRVFVGSVTGGPLSVHTIGIQSDDGTANHLPTGTYLSQANFTPATGNTWHSVTIPACAINAGTIYHLVIIAPSDASAAKYATIRGSTPKNTLIALTQATDAYQEVLTNTGTWVAQGRSPTYILESAGPTYEGNTSVGGAGGDSAPGYFIAGSTWCGEQFVLEGGTYTVTAIGFYLKEIGAPADSCYYELRGPNSFSNVIENGVFAAPGGIGQNYVWKDVNLTVPRTLVKDSRYWLMLRSAGSTAVAYYYAPAGTDYGTVNLTFNTNRSLFAYASNGASGNISTSSGSDIAFRLTYNISGDDAQLVTNTIPTAMVAGSTQTVTVTMRNSGTSTWSAASSYRLGAGTTVNGSPRNNEFSWTNFTSGGYSNSVTDQRAYLGADVAPSNNGGFTFDIVAPPSAGTHYFEARMVRDGTGWFGTNLEVAVNVTVVGDTTAPTTPSLVSPSNGSTSTSGSVAFDWSDVTDPSGVTYSIQVDNNSDFSSPEVNLTGLSSSQYTASLSNGTYSWHVRAVDGATNASAWTSAYTVIVNATTETYYGNPFVLFDVTPITLDSATKKMSIRFTAQRGGTADQIRIYTAVNGTAPNYTVGIQANSGGNPSGTMLGSGTITPGSTNSWHTITLSPTVSITQGSVYHIVIEAGATAPTTVNNIAPRTGTVNNKVATYSGAVDDNCNVLAYTGSWAVQNTQPLYIVRYNDSTAEGAPYVGFPAIPSGYYGVWGSSWAAQEFTVKNNSRQVDTLSLYLTRSGTPGNLNFELRDITASQLVSSGTFATESVVVSTGTYGWVTKSLGATYTLNLNSKYRIVLNAPTSTTRTNSYTWNSPNTVVAGSPYADVSYGGATEGAFVVSTNSGGTWQAPSTTASSDAAFKFNIVGGSGPSDTTPPAPVNNLVATPGTSAGSVQLNWTATGDDSSTGQASSYIIKQGQISWAQDFDSETAGTTPANWTELTPTFQVQTDQANSGTNSVKGTDSTSGRFDGNRNFTAVTQDLKIEFYMRKNLTTTSNWLVLRNAAGNARAYNMTFMNDGNIKVYSGTTLTTLTTYSQDTWYKVEIYLDFTNRKHVTWINGVRYPASDGYDFNLSTATNIDQLWVVGHGANSGQSVWFDDIKVIAPFTNVSGTVPTPQTSGSAEAMTVGSLTGGSTYYFVLWARDEVPNTSANSNVSSAYANTGGVGDTTPPADINNLAAQPGTSQGSVRLDWTATGDDGNTGQASSYVIKQAQLSWEQNFDSDTAGNVPTNWVQNAGGTFVVQGDFANSGSNSAKGTDGGSSRFDATRDFSSAVQDMKLEFYIRKSTTTKTNYLLLRNKADDGRAYQLSFFGDGNIRIYNGLTLTTVQPYSADTWYKVEVYLDFTNKKHITWVNGTRYPTTGNYSFNRSTVTAVDQLWLVGDQTGGGYSVWFDDIKLITPFTNVSGSIPTPQSAGSAETMTVGSLTGGSTYYFVLWARDEVPNSSANSNIVSAYANPSGSGDVTPPANVNNLQAVTGTAVGTVRLTWSAPGDDGNTGALTGEYRIQYLTSNGPFDRASAQVIITTTSVTPTNLQTAIIGSLTPGTSYYFMIWTRDEVATNWSGNSNTAYASAYQSSTQDITPPAAVNDLTAAPGVGAGAINLTWTSTGDDGNTGTLTTGSRFHIQYSTDSGIIWGYDFAQVKESTAAVNPGSLQSYTVRNLTAGNTYYFRLWIADEAALWSADSNLASGRAQTVSSDTRAPEILGSPTALATDIGLIGNKLVITGYTVSDAINVSGLTVRLKWKLQEPDYQIIISTIIPAPSNPNDGINYSVRFEPRIDKTGTLQFYLEADDGQNPVVATSTQTVIIKNSFYWSNVRTSATPYKVPDGNPEDGEPSVLIPTGALKDTITLTIEQLDPTTEPAASETIIDQTKNNRKPVAVYNFKPINKVFEKPVEITLSYFDSDKDSKPELINGSEVEMNENSLRLYFYDGYSWRLIGGTPNYSTKTIKGKVSQFGKYALFAFSGKLPEDPVRPEEKFITQNIGASFGVNAEEVKIYDVSGNEIINLDKSDFGGGIITWYGKDKESKPIESGAYIYKILDKDNKPTYGTIIIVK